MSTSDKERVKARLLLAVEPDMKDLSFEDQALIVIDLEARFRSKVEEAKKQTKDNSPIYLLRSE